MQRLHLVFGGELVDPSTTVFKDVNDLHIVGIFPNYEEAYRPSASPARRGTRGLLDRGTGLIP